MQEGTETYYRLLDSWDELLAGVRRATPMQSAFVAGARLGSIRKGVVQVLIAPEIEAVAADLTLAVSRALTRLFQKDAYASIAFEFSFGETDAYRKAEEEESKRSGSRDAGDALEEEPSEVPETLDQGEWIKQPGVRMVLDAFSGTMSPPVRAKKNTTREDSSTD